MKDIFLLVVYYKKSITVEMLKIVLKKIFILNKNNKII